MSRGTKLFLIVFAAALLFSVASVGAATAVVYRAGSVAVEVEPEDGSRYSLTVPAVLAGIALAFVPDDVLTDIGEELEPVWPTVRAAARELDEAPDFVLLEVRSDGDRVIIEKKGHRLLVLVETADDRVRVAVPIRTMRRLVERFGDAAHLG
jgi:hypothetical protein